MAGHRRCIAERKVQVDLAICVGDLRTARGDGIRRDGRGPALHPTHRHTTKKAFARTSGECCGTRVGECESFGFRRKEGGEARVANLWRVAHWRYILLRIAQRSGKTGRCRLAARYSTPVEPPVPDFLPIVRSTILTWR